MALSIKTEEADRLARELAGLTGRSMTSVVTEALAEKLERERGRARIPVDQAKLQCLLTEMRQGADLTPVSKAEWDAVWAQDDRE